MDIKENKERKQYVRFLKDQMEVIAQSFEECDLESYKASIEEIHFQSSRMQVETLRDFTAGYLKLIETYGFDGIYAKIQELVDRVTETINSMEPLID